MAGTSMKDAPFSTGQNEGTDRSVLPFPELSNLRNARYRKNNRLGKRYGASALSSVNNSGVTLGNGTGNTRVVGPGFAVVDDQCAVFDNVTQNWVDPRQLDPLSPRVPGAISGWVPDTGFFPVPALSQQGQTLTPCAQCFGIGYLWTAISFVDPLNSPDPMIRVVATNPNDQTLVFTQDFRASTPVQGGLQYPKLVVCGATVILVYMSRQLNAARAINGRRLNSLAGGFSAEVTLDANVSSGTGFVAFDAVPYTATQFLLTSVDSTVTQAIFWAFDAATFAHPTPITYSAAGTPQILAVSMLTTSTAVYFTASLNDATKSIYVTVYTLALALVGTVRVDVGGLIQGAPGYCAPLANGDVRCVFGYTPTAGSTTPLFYFRDVTAGGALAAANPLAQLRFQPISRPFSAGSQVYLWCTNQDASGGFGYATLLRLPAAAEVTAQVTGTVVVASCPIEMSPQDFLVRSSPPVFDQLGLPFVTRIGTTAAYSFVSPALFSVPDTSVPFSHGFRAVQARHYTDAIGARTGGSLIIDGASFIPGGTLSRLGKRGAVEEGFVLPPAISSITPNGVGGAMTPSSVYKYAAVFKARSELSGRFEVSAVSAVGTATMGASDTKVNILVLAPTVGARQNTQVELYRTAANGSVFYLVDSFDRSIVYLDTFADSVVTKRQVLYTQVGQTLPNAFPPPSRFGVVGGQRIWLGGLFRNDVVHCSKLILGDQSPSWADSDSFRVLLPAPCTGLAWMDNLVAFTAEGIYVISGDGPDDSGNGGFSSAIRLPFALGCIEPRSVFTIDDGTFFQTARGLYLLPRGFGSPVPAGDAVLDSLATYPIITGCAALTKHNEQTIRWTCLDSLAATAGQQIVYDVVHKAWSLDYMTDQSNTSQTAPVSAIGQWLGGELVLGMPTPLFSATSSSFNDTTWPIAMSATTGDIRLFGMQSHGVIQRTTVLAEVRSACTLTIARVTDQGSGSTTRVFTATPPDEAIGALAYTECQLGSGEVRDVTSLRLTVSESSTSEGLAFIGLALEQGPSLGLKLLPARDRVT